MGFLSFVGLIFVVVMVLGVLAAVAENKKVAAMSPSDRLTYQAKLQAVELTKGHGDLHPMMLCPHCQEKGNVRTQAVKRKKGVSGGKATAAILTGGVSLLATGLSRKELSTEAYCSNCGSKWDF
jgi:hypothetical protein